MSANVLYLPDELAASILSATARTYPLECCGLIEGTDASGGWRAIAVHETANLAQAPSCEFLIDPQVQFDLLRKLRSTTERIIGCFHSHPDGVPQPSDADLVQAIEPGFLWLIAGGTPEAGFTLRCFVFDEGTGFASIDIA